MSLTSARRWLPLLSVAALIACLGLDIGVLADILHGGAPQLAWWLAGATSLVVWVAAWLTLRNSRHRHSPGRRGWSEARRGASPSAPADCDVACLALWILPTLVLCALVGYGVWRLVPATQVVVLVADLDGDEALGSGVYTDGVTAAIRDTLAQREEIVVKQLPGSIGADRDVNRARRLVRRPWIEAALVVWGQSAPTGSEPTQRVHMELLRQGGAAVHREAILSYGPRTVAQGSGIAMPRRIDLTLAPERHPDTVADLIAGLALMMSGNYEAAQVRLDEVLQGTDAAVDGSLARVALLYRGASDVALRQAESASADLRSLVATLDTSGQAKEPLLLAALSNLGLAARQRGEYAAASAAHQRALALNERLGNLRGQAWDLSNLGVVAISSGEYEAARGYLQRALALYQRLGDPVGQASQLGNLGAVAMERDDYATAHGLFTRSMRSFRRLRDPVGQAAQHGNLGLVAARQGEYSVARDHLQRAVERYKQLGDVPGQARQLDNLGLVALDQGDYAAARDHYQRALSLFERSGDPLGQAQAYGNLGTLARAEGRLAEAHDYHQSALELFERFDNPLGQAQSLGNLGLVARQRKDYAAAKAYFQRALDLHRELGNAPGEANQLGNLGALAADEGDTAAARSYIQRALAIHQRLGDRLGQAQDLANLALLAELGGQRAQACDLLGRSAALYQEMNVPIHGAISAAVLRLGCEAAWLPTTGER